MTLGHFGGSAPRTLRVAAGGSASQGDLMQQARDELANSPEGEPAPTRQIVAQAASQGREALGSTSSPTTSSTTYVDMPEMTLTFTPDIATDVLILLFSKIDNIVATEISFMTIDVDGAALASGEGFFRSTTASQGATISLHRIANLTAAEHTVKGQYRVDNADSSAELAGDDRVLNVQELKR